MRRQRARLRRPVLQRPAARSVRAAAGGPERRERRLRDHQGSGGRRADDGRAHPDPLHGRRGQVLLGRAGRRGARCCRRGPIGCSRRWRASRRRPTSPATRRPAPASRAARSTTGDAGGTGARAGTDAARRETGARREPAAATVTGRLPGRGGSLRRRGHQVDDPTALKTWLSDNGYVVSDAASALIDVYVREHKYFVALKLLERRGRETRSSPSS